MARLPIRTVTGPASGRSSRRSSASVTNAVPCCSSPRRSNTFCGGYGSGVDHPVDRRPADGTFLAVPAVEDASVHSVLKLDARANLSPIRLVS